MSDLVSGVRKTGDQVESTWVFCRTCYGISDTQQGRFQSPVSRVGTANCKGRAAAVRIFDEFTKFCSKIRGILRHA